MSEFANGVAKVRMLRPAEGTRVDVAVTVGEQVISGALIGLDERGLHIACTDRPTGPRARVQLLSNLGVRNVSLEGEIESTEEGAVVAAHAWSAWAFARILELMGVEKGRSTPEAPAGGNGNGAKPDDAPLAAESTPAPLSSIRRRRRTPPPDVRSVEPLDDADPLADALAGMAILRTPAPRPRAAARRDADQPRGEHRPRARRLSAPLPSRPSPGTPEAVAAAPRNGFADPLVVLVPVVNTPLRGLVAALESQPADEPVLVELPGVPAHPPGRLVLLQVVTPAGTVLVEALSTPSRPRFPRLRVGPLPGHLRRWLITQA